MNTREYFAQESMKLKAIMRHARRLYKKTKEKKYLKESVRAQRRLADLQDTGLLIQQTITIDLASRDELKDNQYVEVHYDDNGNIVAEVINDDTQPLPSSEEPSQP